MDERHDCGHTDAEHDEHEELHHLVERVQAIPNPRVAFILTEEGTVHFASSVPAGEAAQALLEMAERLRRYGGNSATEHFDRARSAHLN